MPRAITTVRWTAEALFNAVQVKELAVPSPFELRVLPQDGTPDLVLGFEVRDGVPQCRRAELLSTQDGREVLANDLRGVRLEDFLELAMEHVALSQREGRQEGETVTMAWSPADADRHRRDVLRQTRSVRREARRQLTDERLREVAQIYRDNISDKPTAAVADHFERAHRTGALYVQQARERIDPLTGKPFLGAAVRGKAGEQP